MDAYGASAGIMDHPSPVGPVTSYADATASDTERFGKHFRGLLENGVYFAPSQFEACFFSTAHGEEEVSRTLDAAKKTFATLS